MDAPVLVEVTRDPAVESRHRGQIVVLDPRGGLVKQMGDPETLVCLRSLAKPFQALALIATGAHQAFGFGPEELALFSGSLSGQDFQADLVTRALARLGLTPEALQCGIHPPLHRPSAQALSQAGLKPTPLHNTCAGKHTAMLALCVHHKWPLENYLAVDHPVQHLILGTVGRICGLPRDEIKVAIDGCGAPVFFMPLKNIALGYARLAASQPGSPGGDLLAAILAHPRHIAGDGRLDTDIMTALPEAVFAKSGAEGGYALSLKKGGLGVALKIEDGGARALAPTVVEVLQQLGVAPPAALEALAAYAQPAILNHRKEEVGRIRPVFSL
ncbi:MAG: asparaginase [Thermodesulfobacteriota bacterium]